MRIALSLVAAIGLFAVGCSQAPPENPQATETSHDHEHITLCGSCGQVKGSEACCADSAEKCAECALAKGSPACCKKLVVDAKDVDLCGDCGHVAHSEKCCADGSEHCEKCGWAKGSPACCKIEKTTAAASGEGEAPAS